MKVEAGERIGFRVCEVLRMSQEQWLKETRLKLSGLFLHNCLVSAGN